jgi:iron complex transport system permease protein
MNNELIISKRSINVRTRRSSSLFILLFLIAAAFFILDIFLGSVSVGFNDVIKAIVSPSGTGTDIIILSFRIPKALTALLTGIALSMSGLLMQTVFRNPMAGPYVLGISSGASLGVAIVILGFAPLFSSSAIGLAGNWVLVISAWAGAGLIMFLIMIISSRVKDIMTILILGLMLSSGISALVTILQYFSNETLLKAYVIWTMGSLGNLTSDQLIVLSITVFTGLFIGFSTVKMLNALLLGENYAASLGLNVRAARTLIFISTSILAGSVTAFCGPIGFIGIAVPHIARMIFRTSDHRILIPGTILAGGAIMLLCDVISQVPGSENVLPVNAITSLVGIPVVIWVILRNRKYSEVF